MIVALKFIDDLALTQKMPLVLTNVALDVGEVIEKRMTLKEFKYKIFENGTQLFLEAVKGTCRSTG